MHDKGEWVKYSDHVEILKKSNDRADELAMRVANLQYLEGELRRQIDANIDEYFSIYRKKDKWELNFFIMLIANIGLLGFICAGLN